MRERIKSYSGKERGGARLGEAGREMDHGMPLRLSAARTVTQTPGTLQHRPTRAFIAKCERGTGLWVDATPMNLTRFSWLILGTDNAAWSLSPRGTWPPAPAPAPALRCYPRLSQRPLLRSLTPHPAHTREGP